MQILLIDNFDSFTYNIYHYILLCGIDCRLIRNDENVEEVLQTEKFSGIIFSPGPMRPENHPVIFDLIEKYHTTLPMLGICLGHQAMGEYFGANLVKSPKPMHGKISAIHHTGHVMFSGIPGEINVARYHSLIVEGLEKTVLKITSVTAEGLPMSFAHKDLPLWGIQFHPEAIQTQYGLKMLKNWTSIFS